MTITVLWLRQDVRLDHHAGWRLAASFGDPVCPTWILPPVQVSAGISGLDRYGAAKARFWLDTLEVLDARLAPAGTVWTPRCCPVEALRHWHRLTPIRVLTSAAQAPEEADWLAQLRASGINVITYSAQTLLDDEQAAALSAHAATFSQFRRRLEKSAIGPSPAAGSNSLPDQWACPPASLGKLPCARQWLTQRARNANRQPQRHPAHRGGELAACEWLEDYLHNQHGLSHYKDTRNRLQGLTAGSHLSGYLSSGALCPRRAWQGILDWEACHGSNQHSAWLKQELLWREFFHWSLRKNGAKVFRWQGLTSAGPAKAPIMNAQRREYWRRWCQAMTGIPFIDAALNELHATGFLTNRVRQNLASFFIHDMGMDWRWGAEYFQHYLLDDDVASNWGNWAYIAGRGHDARGGRRFSIVRQLLRHDPQLDYLRHWLPALSSEDTAALLQRHFTGLAGARYPAPMLRLPVSDDPRTAAGPWPIAQ